jgi:hypothetical protein
MLTASQLDVLPEPFRSHLAYKIIKWHRAPWRHTFRLGRSIASLNEADVISSFDPASGLHRVMMDVDVRSWSVPSTTPGHVHLYFEPTVTWRQYRRILRAMSQAGLVERAYYQAACGARAGMLRLPWIKKTAAFYAAESSGDTHRMPDE